jgi:hypothetical protein
LANIRIAVYGLIAFAMLSHAVDAQPRTKLQRRTIEAFDKYIKEADRQFQLTLSGKKPFLWMNTQNEEVREQVRRGELVVIKDKENEKVPGGIIHIWGVLTFITGTTAEDVAKLLQDYDRHKDIYPSVIDSKLLGKKGNIAKGFLRFRYKKVITVVLNTEHESELIKLEKGKYGLRVKSTRIAQVENPGESSEHELPVGQDSGFLWRLNTFWKILQAEGGVFVECQSITLTRSIPIGFGWVIGPFVESIPRDSLRELVDGTRVALRK